jgi:hypothetical protein
LALDPRSELGDRRARGAQRGPRREQHLDAMLGVDADLDAARSGNAADTVGDLFGHVGRIIGAVAETSIVRLPDSVQEPFQVYLNGVLQRPGVDYEASTGVLHFPRRLAADRVSGWRWLLGAFGIGTYRQDDSVDVSYELDGRSHVVQLAIEPGDDD